MRKALVTLGIGAAALALFVCAIALRIAPSAAPRKGKAGTAAEPDVPVAATPPRRVDAATQGRAMRDATLKNLIQNAKVAARRKDGVTREAMLAGLKKDADRSKTLLEAEVARSTDPAEAEVLREMLEELP